MARPRKDDSESVNAPIEENPSIPYTDEEKDLIAYERDLLEKAEEAKRKAILEERQRVLKRRVENRKQELQQIDDETMVTGVFRYTESPKGILEFAYRKYKNTPIVRYKFFDGEIATIPKGVARHINETMRIPKYKHEAETGKYLQKESGFEQRAEFLAQLI